MNQQHELNWLDDDDNNCSLLTLSYASNSSRSCCEQLRPMGDTLIIPVRNSTKVPLMARDGNKLEIVALKNGSE
jgi:hypothetical protein